MDDHGAGRAAHGTGVFDAIEEGFGQAGRLGPDKAPGEAGGEERSQAEDQEERSKTEEVEGLFGHG